MTDQLVGLAEQGLGGANKAGPYLPPLPLSLTNVQFYARCVYYVGPGTIPQVDIGLGSMPPMTALAGLPLAESPLATVSPSEEALPAAMSLLNLLPLASPTLRLPMAGAYVGNGMPPVPAKLVAKIRRWDFVEMGKLLPEFWVTPRDGEGDNKERQARQGRKVTDLCTWLQCYVVYVAVLGPR